MPDRSFLKNPQLATRTLPEIFGSVQFDPDYTVGIPWELSRPRRIIRKTDSRREGRATPSIGDGGRNRDMICTDSSKKYARKTVRFHKMKIGSIISCYLQKYAKIEPHIMPFAAPYSRSGSDHFLPQQKTHSGMRSASKTRLCERFNSSDCQNTAHLGLFLNGAQIGLRLDPKKVSPGSIWARISVGHNPPRISGEGGNHIYPFDRRVLSLESGKDPLHQLEKQTTSKGNRNLPTGIFPNPQT